MSNIPCPFPCNPCLDPENPIMGFSSETPDGQTFLCSGYGPGQLVPPLDSCWQQRNFVSFTSSTISEDIACELADTLVQEAAAVAWCQTQFTNTAQTCPVTCPDGSQFFYTVSAGLFFANNQDAANALAMQFACEQAPSNSICIGLLSANESCLGHAFTAEIVATTNNAPLVFFIGSGQLPNGLVLVQDSPVSAVITGTPTVAGEFDFTVAASDSLGNFAQRLMAVKIMALANGSVLTPAVVGTAYSLQLALTATPDNAPFWSISAGTLPDGLSLNQFTGVISGMPTTAATVPFSVSFSDGAVNCSTPVSIAVHGPDFTTGLAAWYKINEYPAGTPITSTRLLDFSGNGNAIPDLVNNLAGCSWVNGRAGTVALEFVGGTTATQVRQEIFNALTGLPTGHAAFSICAWVRRTTLTPVNNIQAIFGFGNNSGAGSRACLVTDLAFNGIGLEVDTGAVEMTIPNDTNWHHYAIVWAGGAVSLGNAVLYLDGVVQAHSRLVDVTPNLPGPGTREISINGLPGDNNDPLFNSDIDISDARIYTIALTSGNVNSIINAFPPV